MMRWLASTTANKLQRFYEKHRVPETWTTPSVSGPTFDTLRRQGFRSAWVYLIGRLHEVGMPKLSPMRKCCALLCGILIVALANTLLKQEQKPLITRRERRTFSPNAPHFPVALYTLGAAMLVAANEGPGPDREPQDWGESGGSAERVRFPDGSIGYHYPGSDESTGYRAYRRSNEGDGAGEADPEFLDDLDPDGMDS